MVQYRISFKMDLEIFGIVIQCRREQEYPSFVLLWDTKLSRKDKNTSPETKFLAKLFWSEGGILKYYTNTR